MVVNVQTERPMTVKTITFTPEQQAYLVAKVGQEKFAAFAALCSAGLAEQGKVLVVPPLGNDDWTKILSLGVEQAPQGFPSGAASAQVATIGIAAFNARIADTLTSRLRDGSVRFKHNGLAQEYLKGEIAWPTVDAFNRAFPTIEAVAAMSRQDMAQHLTSSGFAKCRLDGLLYFQHRNSGKDNVLYGGDVPKGAWRGYNEQRGTAARFWLPIHHTNRAKEALGSHPEYDALIAQQAAASVPSTTVKAPRRSRKAPASA